MDEKTALKILNLEKKSSFKEAKKAYWNLAKKYHPDVMEKRIKARADARMKEINLAFQYLVTHWKTKKIIKQRHENVQNPEKPGKNRFSSKMFRAFSSVFHGKKTNKTYGYKPNRKKPSRKVKNNKIQFDDIFKNFYTLDPEKKSGGQKLDIYKRYQTYMDLKTRMKSGRMKSSQNMSITRVEKISPVKPLEKR